jgi:transcriptional regulator with XRE-family HTH domain
MPERRNRDGAGAERLPTGVDAHVGSRIRLRRTMLGMSQEKLAIALGLTFQQIQKYERGLNRVGASRLYDLGRVLDVPISFFFDDMPDGLPTGSSDEDGLEAGPGTALDRAETLQLIRAYYRIVDPSLRKRVFELVKSIGPSGPEPKAGPT